MEPLAIPPIIPITRKDDLHNLEHMDDAGLILFMAGNQFMAMKELVEEFQAQHADIDRIFYETLPPGLELRQILAGGASFGDRTLTGRPDIYTSVSETAMETLRAAGRVENYIIYLHNRLVLMVQGGNPRGIKGLKDLARDDIRVSEPGPMEDISNHIGAMYLRAGGEALLNRVREEKRADGTALLTMVHHRETPLRLRKGTADVGPVWATEVINSQKLGEQVEAVEVGPEFDMHERVNYYAAILKDAPNPENALRFMDFLTSSRAQNIFCNYGFVPMGA